MRNVRGFQTGLAVGGTKRVALDLLGDKLYVADSAAGAVLVFASASTMDGGCVARGP